MEDTKINSIIAMLEGAKKREGEEQWGIIKGAHDQLMKAIEEYENDDLMDEEESILKMPMKKDGKLFNMEDEDE